jgi:hypothetical protein
LAAGLIPNLPSESTRAFEYTGNRIWDVKKEKIGLSEGGERRESRGEVGFSVVAAKALAVEIGAN